MTSAIRFAVIVLFGVVLSTTSSLAQAPGYVRVKFVKAGLMLGAGDGSGVLGDAVTYLRRRGAGGSPRSRCQIVPLSN